MSLALIAPKGRKYGPSYPLNEKQTVVFGNNVTSQIRLRFDGIQDKHLQLVRKGDQALLTSFGSDVRVNGIQVYNGDSMDLKDRDYLSVFHRNFQYFAKNPPEKGSRVINKNENAAPNPSNSLSQRPAKDIQSLKDTPRSRGPRKKQVTTTDPSIIRDIIVTPKRGQKTPKRSHTPKKLKTPLRSKEPSLPIQQKDSLIEPPLPASVEQTTDSQAPLQDELPSSVVSDQAVPMITDSSDANSPSPSTPKKTPKKATPKKTPTKTPRSVVSATTTSSGTFVPLDDCPVVNTGTPILSGSTDNLERPSTPEIHEVSEPLAPTHVKTYRTPSKNTPKKRLFQGNETDGDEVVDSVVEKRTPGPSPLRKGLCIPSFDSQSVNVTPKSTPTKRKLFGEATGEKDHVIEKEEEVFQTFKQLAEKARTKPSKTPQPRRKRKMDLFSSKAAGLLAADEPRCELEPICALSSVGKEQEKEADSNPEPETNPESALPVTDEEPMVIEEKQTPQTNEKTEEEIPIPSPEEEKIDSPNVSAPPRKRRKRAASSNLSMPLATHRSLPSYFLSAVTPNRRAIYLRTPVPRVTPKHTKDSAKKMRMKKRTQQAKKKKAEERKEKEQEKMEDVKVEEKEEEKKEEDKMKEDIEETTDRGNSTQNVDSQTEEMSGNQHIVTPKPQNQSPPIKRKIAQNESLSNSTSHSRRSQSRSCSRSRAHSSQKGDVSLDLPSLLKEKEELLKRREEEKEREEREKEEKEREEREEKEREEKRNLLTLIISFRKSRSSRRRRREEETRDKRGKREIFLI